MKKLKELTANKIRNLKILFFDFDGVFTNNLVIVSETGVESVLCSRLDGIGISKLRKKGHICFVVSSESNDVVLRRCEKLQIDCLHNVEDKMVSVKKILNQYDYTADEALFVGNDVNDIPGFMSVGLCIGVSDRHPDINSYLDYITSSDGGNGAVREICDKVFSLKLELEK